MGIRYYNRINLGRGLGINVSKSGLSPSIRTNIGSIGPKIFSIRTGVPGLSYRGGMNKNSGLTWLIIIVCIFCITLIYNILKLTLFSGSLLLSYIFKENGIDYLHLVIVLSIVFLLLLISYFTLILK
jgi:hypothetical protein